MAKIIIRLDTDDKEKIDYFMNALSYGEFAVIPKDIQILIKDKDGYWKEVEL